jgi:outer membrane biosynthesis protein TonB
MRSIRPFRGLVLSLALVAAACGGGKTTSDPKSPADGEGHAASTPSPGPTAGSGGSSPNADPASAGSTTTTAVPAGGELQGAKLSESNRKEVTTKGEGGPKPNGPSTEPGRTREDIQTKVGSYRDQARACYDKALEKHPGIEGDLDVKWKIDPQGGVADAMVDTSKSQILEPSVGSCVVEVIKKIKFAPSQKGFETHAHYPFNFHPKNAPAKPAPK